MTSSGSLQDTADGGDQPIELLAFRHELLPTGSRQRVVPGPPVALGGPPLGLDVAVQQQSLQAGYSELSPTWSTSREMSFRRWAIA
jgi:hypothetical protein